MRIGIDARFYGPNGKGLGRYTQKLIEYLEKIDSENTYLIFLRRHNFDEYKPKKKNFSKILSDCAWYSFSEQIKMPYLLKRHKLDLVHFPHFNIPLLYKGKFVVTIHDLILLNFPTLKGTTLHPLFYWIKYLIYRIVIKTAINKSRKIIAVSESTRQDIIKNYSVDVQKIEITYEGVDVEVENAAPIDGQDKILEKYGIIKPYILYVGNAYPHKNLDRLVQAFGIVSSKLPKLHLVLVGKEDYFYDKLKKFSQSQAISNIIFAGFAQDSDLGIVYRNAEMFVFPSLYEGFGLPPLESMARNVPVLVSDRPVFREILGDAAHYCDPEEVDSIAQAILTLLCDEILREQLKRRGNQAVKKYSWQIMADKTLEIYKEALKS